MKIDFSPAIECKMCGDKRLNPVDLVVMDDYIGHMLVVAHCTWCDYVMETLAPIDLDGCIRPRINRRVWRSTHNDVREWPYGTATVGCFRVFEDIAKVLRPGAADEEIPF